MKLIESKAELLPWIPGLEGVYKTIEVAGRTCYKSMDKITEDSAEGFVNRMIKSNHTAMLEHGAIYLIKEVDYNDANYHGFAELYEKNPYSKVTYNGGYCYISTNLRVIVENHLFVDLKYLCDPTEFHEERHTFKLTTSIGVSRELIRHRTLSFAEQSTRYCNYSKDKFGNEVTFCIPEWVDRNRDPNTMGEVGWLASVKYAERNYLDLIKQGWQPQQAREVLPLCTATEIVVTGFASDWRHFFDLRLFEKTGKVHPNMKQLAELMKAEAEKQGIWEDIMNYKSKFNK